MAPEDYSTKPLINSGKRQILMYHSRSPERSINYDDGQTIQQYATQPISMTAAGFPHTRLRDKKISRETAYESDQSINDTEANFPQQPSSGETMDYKQKKSKASGNSNRQSFQMVAIKEAINQEKDEGQGQREEEIKNDKHPPKESNRSKHLNRHAIQSASLLPPVQELTSDQSVKQNQPNEMMSLQDPPLVMTQIEKNSDKSLRKRKPLSQEDQVLSEKILQDKASKASRQMGTQETISNQSIKKQRAPLQIPQDRKPRPQSSLSKQIPEIKQVHLQGSINNTIQQSIQDANETNGQVDVIRFESNEPYPNQPEIPEIGQSNFQEQIISIDPIIQSPDRIPNKSQNLVETAAENSDERETNDLIMLIQAHKTMVDGLSSKGITKPIFRKKRNDMVLRQMKMMSHCFTIIGEKKQLKTVTLEQRVEAKEKASHLNIKTQLLKMIPTSILQNVSGTDINRNNIHAQRDQIYLVPFRKSKIQKRTDWEYLNRVNINFTKQQKRNQGFHSVRRKSFPKQVGPFQNRKNIAAERLHCLMEEGLIGNTGDEIIKAATILRKRQNSIDNCQLKKQINLRQNKQNIVGLMTDLFQNHIELHIDESSENIQQPLNSIQQLLKLNGLDIGGETTA